MKTICYVTFVGLRTIYESCGINDIDWTKTLTDEQQRQMYAQSPIAHVNKVSNMCVCILN
jgi:hypothetical protein